MLCYIIPNYSYVQWRFVFREYQCEFTADYESGIQVHSDSASATISTATYSATSISTATKPTASEATASPTSATPTSTTPPTAWAVSIPKPLPNRRGFELS